MTLIIGAIALSAALCKALPIERALNSIQVEQLELTFVKGSQLFSCEEIGREQVIVTSPVSDGHICRFEERDISPAVLPSALHILKPKRVAVAALVGSHCPAIDFSARHYPGNQWTFTLGGISERDALQVRALVEELGIQLLDEETFRLKEMLPAISYGKEKLSTFSVSVVGKKECFRDGGVKFDKPFIGCAQAAVFNDLIRGWLMNFAKLDNGKYLFVASSRIVY